MRLVDVVKKPQWLLKKVVRPTQSVCLSTEVMAMERSSREEGASWKDLESERF